MSSWDDRERTAVFEAPHGGPTLESERLEAWVQGHLRARMANAVTLTLVAPPRAAAVAPKAGTRTPSRFAASETLPFFSPTSAPEAASETEATRLERWVALALARAARVDAHRSPVSEAGPFVPPRDVGKSASARGSAEATGLAPSRLEPAKRAASQSDDTRSFVPLALDVYARVKVASWQSTEALDALLARHGIDELRWRMHESWLAHDLDRRGKERDTSLALALAEALRAERAGAARGTPKDEDLPRYTALCVAMEQADEDEQDRVLESEGLTRAEWGALSAAWNERARREPALASALRGELRRARNPRLLDAAPLASA